MNWFDLNLGDALRVTHGFAFKGEFFAQEGQLLVVTPGNFVEAGGFRVRPGKERYYTSDFPEDYLLCQDDLVIAMTEQGEGLLGAAARIPDDEKYLHNQRIGRVKITRAELLDKRFAYWLFNSRSVREQLRGSSTGTKVKHTAPERIYKVRVQVPSVEAQAQIATLLDAYDDLIETNRRRIALLEESAQLLYREWFVQLRYPGHSLTKDRQALPPGWRVRSLGEVVTVNRSSLSSQDKPDEIRYIDIASVEIGSVLATTKMPFTDAPGRARRKVQHGDVIWSCVRPNRRSYALLWQPHADILVSTGFAVLTAGDIPFSYLYFATTSDEFVSYLTNRATGAAYPAVKGRDFEEAPLLCPPPELLQDFHESCLPMLELRNTLMEQNANLTEARDALLPKLISGEIQV
jgi:type I restriction enzyme S subunit